MQLSKVAQKKTIRIRRVRSAISSITHKSSLNTNFTFRELTLKARNQMKDDIECEEDTTRTSGHCRRYNSYSQKNATRENNAVEFASNGNGAHHKRMQKRSWVFQGRNSQDFNGTNVALFNIVKKRRVIWNIYLILILFK